MSIDAPTFTRITFFALLLAAGSLTGSAQQLATGPASAALPEAPGYSLAASTAASSEPEGISSSQPASPQGTAVKPGDKPVDPTQQTPPQQQSVAAPPHQDPQTKRILGIIPNFRAVSTDVKLPPQSAKDKFIAASQDSFDYSSIVLPIAIAGYNQAVSNTPEFGTGGVAYGRYLWHSTVDQTAENYWVEFIVPSITHEDTRYYTLGKGGFSKRAVYAISRVAITRSDSDKEVFNAGEVVGAAISSAETNLYYPRAERTVGNTLSQYGVNLGIDGLSFMLREFWPDINHALFHVAKTPIQ